MASAQARIAETVSLFYSADKASDVSLTVRDNSSIAYIQGAMAGHAYKAAVDEMDAGVSRDLVSLALALDQMGYSSSYIGRSIPSDSLGTGRQAQLVFRYHQLGDRSTGQKGQSTTWRCITIANSLDD